MLVPHISKEIVEAIEEQIVVGYVQMPHGTSSRSWRMLEAVEQIDDVPVLHVKEEFVESIHLLPQERSRQRNVKEVVDVLVPHTRMEIDSVTVSRIQDQIVELERVSDRIVEQIVGLQVPLIRAGTSRVVEQSVLVSMPQVEEESSEMVQIISVDELIVDVMVCAKEVLRWSSWKNNLNLLEHKFMKQAR